MYPITRDNTTVGDKGHERVSYHTTTIHQYDAKVVDVYPNLTTTIQQYETRAVDVYPIIPRLYNNTTHRWWTCIPSHRDNITVGGKGR